MRSYFCWIAVFLVTGLAHAQNYAYVTGNPTLSTQIPIENGFINVNNGDIHIEIPLAVHQQRGRMQLNERLIYDSRIWRLIYNGGYSWSPTNIPSSLGGWYYSSGTQQGTYTYTSYGSTYLCNAGAATVLPYTEYYNFEWTDPSGTQHYFPSTLTQYYNNTQLPVKCLSYSGSPVAEIPNSTGYSTDGSGYYAVISNYTTLTVYDQQGNQYSPTNLDATQPSGTLQVKDTNGNYWTNDANGNLIDTLGRTPVLVTSSGNSIYYSVLGFNGVRNQYTVKTETVNYHTAFDQSDVTDVSGSFTAIQSITLPDGTAYSFTYDSGTASGNYGELTSVTLPGGGVVQYSYSNFLDSFQNENRWVQTRVKDGGTTKFAPSVISQCSSSAGCRKGPWLRALSGMTRSTRLTWTKARSSTRGPGMPRSMAIRVHRPAGVRG
jgi:YD repeat-containing protein